MSNAVDIAGVRKTFGPKVAVEDFDLQVPRGSLLGLIGPNGAGKTTIIRIIMSILFPDRGSVSVLGCASAVESKDRIGYLPEERGLYKKMKVGTFLKYVGTLKGVACSDRDIREWLARVELPDVHRKKCQELSKGMQQKVQFLAAILHKPDLLILDEPFSGLDPVNARLLRVLLDEQHARGCSVIFSTHQMSQAEALCDRVVMIHRGRKVLDHTPAQIRERFNPRSVLLEPVDGADIGSIRSVPGIASVEQHNGVLTAHASEGVEASSLIPLLTRAVPVRRIEVVRPTLEDVFIEIVLGTRDSSDADARALRDSLVSKSRGDGGGD